MGVEIERKFLVDKVKWKEFKNCTLLKMNSIKQAYVSLDPKKIVRIRTSDFDGYITLKGLTTGTSRKEFEYKIPLADAEEMIDIFTDYHLSKIRYTVLYEEFKWEVDEFFGENEGLLIAEIELSHEDQMFPFPEWVGEEVTDPKYYNSSLMTNPYSKWEKETEGWFTKQVRRILPNFLR